MGVYLTHIDAFKLRDLIVDPPKECLRERQPSNSRLAVRVILASVHWSECISFVTQYT